MRLLIDADLLAYTAAFSNEVAEEDEDGYWTWKCKLQDVKESIFWGIHNAMEMTKSDRYSLCLSDTKNFRKSILKTYKEKRKKVKRPVVLKPIREWLISELGAIVYPELEGDDVMGILHTDPNKTEDTLIYSKDKDMKTIQGKLWSQGKIVEISKKEAEFNHYLQTLCGDQTDGYVGIPGIGPAKAKKALSDNPHWNTVVSMYEANKLSEKDALIQARVAKILDHSLWNKDKMTYRLWEPNRANEI